MALEYVSEEVCTHIADSLLGLHILTLASDTDYRAFR